MLKDIFHSFTKRAPKPEPESRNPSSVSLEMIDGRKDEARFDLLLEQFLYLK